MELAVILLTILLVLSAWGHKLQADFLSKERARHASAEEEAKKREFSSFEVHAKLNADQQAKAKAREDELQTLILEREAELDALWRRREANWIERHEKLVDRLLKQANIKGVGPEVKVERTIHYKDPEDPPLSSWDQAIRDDEIVEEIEIWAVAHNRFEIIGLPPDQLKSRYPAIWTQVEKQWEDNHTPLRLEPEDEPNSGS